VVWLVWPVTARARPKSATLMRPSSEMRTVDDPGLVRGTEGREDRLEHLEGLAGAEVAVLADQVAQRAAADQLHREEDVPLVGALVVDGDDVGVGQGCRGARLPAEPGDEALVVDEVGTHDLERDLAVEPLVDAEVDRGHSAVGDATDHAIAAVEGAPDERVAGG
jgi:hypothetical protein